MALSEKRKRRRRPPAAQITPVTPIWCPACQEEHLARAFNKESRKFSGLHGVCRDAQARARQTPEGKAKTTERNQRRWANEEYRGKTRERQRQQRQRHGATTLLKKSRARLQAIVIEWKEQGCVDCGYPDVRAIDPDHVDPSQKHDNISRMVTMCASAQRIRDELDKCLPRCIRCHRQATREARVSKLRTAEHVHRLRTLERDQYRASSRDDRGDSEVVGWHRLAKAPRNGYWTLAAMLDVLSLPQEQVGRPATEVGDLRLAHEEQDVSS